MSLFDLSLRLSRLSFLIILAGLLQLQVCLAQSPGSVPDDSTLTAEDAVMDTLAWATEAQTGSTPNASQLIALYDRLERASYRHQIIPEFALSVVAAEARYGQGISWARRHAWEMVELTTKESWQPYPFVLDDLNTALSELNFIMSNCATVNEVIERYWTGPDGQVNTQSLEEYKEAVSKLWNGLEPFARQRMAQEDSSKYTPEYYAESENDSQWTGIAYGDIAGFRSALGSLPALAEKLNSYGEDEIAYAMTAQHFNPKLTDSQALIIARAILTFCQETDWAVDPRLIMAIIRAESNFRPDAVSSKGALGLGQLMPGTASSYGITDPFDPIQNVYGCVKYVEREVYRWRAYSNWLDLVLASYNAGPGAVKKYNGVPPYKETQAFVRIVKGYYYKLAPNREE